MDSLKVSDLQVVLDSPKWILRRQSRLSMTSVGVDSHFVRIYFLWIFGLLWRIYAESTRIYRESTPNLAQNLIHIFLKHRYGIIQRGFGLIDLGGGFSA